jgi:protoporphyrin/coproporphyrin ferrochelatase
MNHTAVILIALGGPRSLDEVGPFMQAFMGRPAPPPVVQAVVERYRLIGGRSPLPDLVKAQAEALAKELGDGFRAYEGFRYSRPTVAESHERAVRDGAQRVIALSMSPFSNEVTTGAYRSACESLGNGGTCPLFIPSWHDHPLFIKAWEERIFHGLRRFRETKRRHTAVVFTSHSIPVRYIAAGDPYQRQIEETVRLIVGGMGLTKWYIAWQSKGARPTEPWLEPEVETVLDRIAAEKQCSAVLEVPLGFTCDHLETLYDIEIVHRKHAGSLGLAFERTESLNTSPLFIRALADIVMKAG